MDFDNKIILVTPLDWGLGHAGRCIALIEKLQNKNTIIIAGSGDSLYLLKQRFPLLISFELPAYKIRYPKHKFLIPKILQQAPRIIYTIIKEHYVLKKYISKKKVDIIISDNRFGCWHKNVFSIFLTHQLQPLLPKPFSFVETFLYLCNRILTYKFAEYWIPDSADANNLTGKLSHSRVPKNSKYIGTLSRFSKKDGITMYQYDILILLSGPEPQRSILEEILSRTLSLPKHHKICLVRGCSKTCKFDINTDFDIKDFANTNELEALLNTSKLVISRAGYTTIMDLIKLEKNAILIPTPGQTEQEYLSSHLKNNKLFLFLKQKNIQRDLIDNIGFFLGKTSR